MEIWIEGGLSVKAAMLGGKRKVHQILLDQSRHDKDAHFIEQKAKQLGIALKKVSRETIDAQSTGKTHGGVIAEVSPRQYQYIEDALEGTPLLVVLEGVEDPFNLGYIMRTAHTAGCTGLILRKRDWTSAESTILKSSAGAFEYLNVIQSEDIPGLIRECRREGISAYAAMRKDAVPYWQKDYTKPCLIAIGGEMRGLSSKTLQEIDENIYIPYANDFRAALNAAGAAAVITFEAFRQRYH